MNSNTESTYQVASLYVGDLKPDVSDQMLWAAFSGFGQILSVKVCRDSTSSTSLGYAYVNFRTLEEAEKALNTLNYCPIEGKPCRIMWSMRDAQKRRSNIGNLFLKNIDVSIDSRALFEAFSVFGPIMSCKLVTDASGKSKGFGFIQFCNEKDADAALEKANGIEFLNKTLMVSRFLTKSQRLGDSSDGKPRFTNVFCKNFGDEYTTQELKSIFEKFGPITSCVVMNDVNGKSKGFGFVNFEKTDDAEKAVSDLSELKTPTGKPVYVARAMKKAERVEILRQEYMRKRQENMKKCQNLNVYIKPLDPEMTDEKLMEHFEKFGTIVSHKVMKDPTGKSRGFGFVCYTTTEEAQLAITEMNKKVIETKPLFVTIAQTKEERKRDFIANSVGRVPPNPMYQNGGFPLMYGPQPFPQGFPSQRFPQIPVGQRPVQRSGPPMNPQVFANHPRGPPFPPNSFPNTYYVPRQTRPMTGAPMGQQKPSMMGSQNRGYPAQYVQGPAYSQMPDGQNYRMQSGPPPSVQSTMNYVSASVNAVDETTSSLENVGQNLQLSTSDDHSKKKVVLEKVALSVKGLYPLMALESQTKLCDIVIDSLKSDIARVNNESALKECIIRAHEFLTKHMQTHVKDSGVSTPVGAVSSS